MIENDSSVALSPVQLAPESEGKNGVLPVSSVTVVTSVTNQEGNNSNKGNDGNKEHYPIVLSPDFAEGKSEKERLAILYYNEREGMTDEKAAEILNIDRGIIKVYRQRLSNDGVLRSVGTDRPRRFGLNDKGRAKLALDFLGWRRDLDESARQAMLLRDASKDLSMQSLDLPAQIEVWRSFFDSEPYKSQLFEQVRKGDFWVVVRFGDVAKHSPELAELVLQQPEDTLKAAEIAIEKIDLATFNDEDVPRILVRVTGLSDVRSLGTLGTKDLGKFLEVQCQIVVAGERRSQTVSARFECPSCGNVLAVLQVDQKFKEPTRCGCGRKGKFKVLSRECVDAVTLVVQQPISEMVGKSVAPAPLMVALTRDLTRPEVRDQLGLSKIVRVVGILEEVPVVLKTGGTSTRSEWRFNANSITLVDHYNPQLRLSPERIKEILADAQRPDFMERLRDSYFPHHIGDDQLREILVAQSVAMPLHVHNEDAYRQAEREALHVVIMTPPGMGKSRNLAGRLLDIVPIKGRANGTGATRAGLTIGADQRDPESDLVIPSPQALPKANLGLFVFDELDKMRIEEQPVLNDALSEHQVTVAKRGVNLTLPTMICFLGLANPRSYDWNLDQNKLQDVLNIHYTLLTRNVVWVGKDVPREDHDTKVAMAILQRDKNLPRFYDDDFLRDYILLARATIIPVMTCDQDALLAKFYSRLRKIQTRNYVGPRFVEQARSLILLRAKAHLRNVPSIDDLRWANDVLVKQLLSVGFDPNRLPETLPRLHE